MDFISFCSCGKPIDEAFIYCPWCGIQRKAQNDKNILDDVFSQLEEKQSENRESRVKKIESRIAQLEKELSELTGEHSTDV